MVDEQIAARGVRDPAVLRAMRRVPREAFVPPHLAEFAYEDAPLPIGDGQTISQPYIVALMLEAARLGKSDRVLEVGTGSGYTAAVLAEIAGEVFTVERNARLAERSAERLRQLGYATVQVLHADGSRGWPEHAPFDAIICSAAAAEVPRALMRQLAPGGRLLVPVGEPGGSQTLKRLVRTAELDFEEEALASVAFVPLIVGTEEQEGEGRYH